MKSQITVFMLLGLILLVGLLTVLAYAVLVVTGTLVNPFVASDVASYFNTCFDQSLQCSLFQRGLFLDSFDLPILQESTQKLALDSFPLCLRNISSVFRQVSMESGGEQISLFFAERETKMTLENVAVVRIGKAVKKISGLVSEKPVAFSRIVETARNINPPADKLDSKDNIIADLDQRYRTYFFETSESDVVVLRDVQSNISYRNPYAVVFSSE